MSQSRRSRPCATGLLFALSLLIPAAVASAAPILEFEDIFGPCGDLTFTQGPGTATFSGVTFATPDPFMFNFGKGGPDPVFLRTPFLSDWLAIHTFGNGATITFPQPITALSFDTGVVDTWVGSQFRLRIGTDIVTTFWSTYAQLNHISVTFPQPRSSVNLQFIEDTGPGGALGIDSLTYTPIPEPTTLGILATSALLASRRHRHRPRTGPR